jgi:hypothetical protein
MHDEALNSGMKESSASSNTMHDLSAVLQLGPVVQVSLG